MPENTERPTEPNSSKNENENTFTGTDETNDAAENTGSEINGENSTLEKVDTPNGREEDKLLNTNSNKKSDETKQQKKLSQEKKASTKMPQSEEVHTNAYIKNNSGTINMGADSLKDPTIPKHLSTLVPSDIKVPTEQLDVLEQNRIIILTCYDSIVCKQAISSLIKSIQIDQEFELRSLDVAQRRIANTNDVVAMELGLLTDQDRKIGKKDYVLVHVHVTDVSFLQSLIIENEDTLHHYKAVLANRNRLVICSINKVEWVREIEQKQKAYSFSNWHIPFTDHWLKREYPNEYQDLRHRLKKDKSNDEYAYFLQFAEKGFAPNQISVKSKETTDQRVRQRELLFQSPLNKYLLYTVANFDGITFKELEKIVGILLTESKEKGIVKKEYLTKKGDTRKKQEYIHINQLWIENSDKYLRELGITFSSNSDGEPEVNLSSFSSKKLLKKLISENYPAFWERNFLRIFYSAELFLDNNRHGFEQQLVRFISESAKISPHLLSDTYLGEVFELFKKLEWIEDQKNRKIYSYRVFYMLSEVLISSLHLGNQLIANNISSFLRNLIFSDPLDLLNLLIYLESVQGFPKVEYYYSLLNREDKRVQYLSARQLFYIGLRKPMSLKAYGALVFSQKNKERGIVTHYAHLNSFDYLLEKILVLDSNDYGKRPTSYFLFQADFPKEIRLQFTNELFLANWAELYCESLMHLYELQKDIEVINLIDKKSYRYSEWLLGLLPEISEAMADQFTEFTLKLKLISILKNQRQEYLEECIHVILGFEASAREDNQSLLDEFLCQLCAVMDRRDRKEFIQNIRLSTDRYLFSYSASKKDKSRAMAKRRNLKVAIKTIKQVSKNNDAN